MATRTQTKIADLVNPQVMADMITAKIDKRIVVTPFAKIDDTLVGRAGDTISVPQYAYIGDAVDVAEGVASDTVKLTASATPVKVKKAMKAVELTDEALLSGYGDPANEATNQLAKAIASKVDEDAMTALQGAQLAYDGSASKISYAGIVDAIDKFNEEFNSNKVIFVNPAQVSALRKDPNFLAADKISGDLIVTGAIGKIANCEVVASKRVPKVDANANFSCPIVSLDTEEGEAPAITIYKKRDVNVETERETLSRITIISADELYAAALSNTSKVVLAKYKV